MRLAYMSLPFTKGGSTSPITARERSKNCKGSHGARSFLLLVLRHLLLEWFAPSFIIGNLAQRSAFLLTLPDGLSRVAERKDREDRDLLGNAQQGVDLWQAVEAHPIFPAAFLPSPQNHPPHTPPPIRAPFEPSS